MANGPVEYQSRVGLGQGPAPAVRGAPLPGVPALPDVGAADRALSALGAELGVVAEKLQQGQQQTLASQGMETFLVSNAKLRQEHVDSQDYQGAEASYNEQATAAKRDALADITDPHIRAQTSLQMERQIISGAYDVRTAQVKRESDINIAANDTLQQTSLNEAVTAKSPAERVAAIDRVSADLERLHGAGWIDAQTAVSRFKSFSGQLDQADAMALVQSNPAKAIEALNTSGVFPSLDPVRRESLKIAAQGRLDGNSQAAVVNAAAFHPEAASLAIGRVAAPDHVQKIFDNGIVPIESGGDNSVVSPKGALGVSQILPGTAREVATALGRKDIAALSDDDLKKRLLSDQALNLQLGRAYFQQMAIRYESNVALAAAAYNAGPGRADKWKAQAEEKFGAGFSPGQLASIVDIKETREYIGKLYGKFNAPMDVQFSSPSATLQATAAVGAVLQQQDAREKHLLTTQAAAAETSDPIPSLMRAGYEVAPQRIADYRATQTAAAARGDAAAAGRLRDLDFAEKTQPLIRQAWSTPPALLDAGIKQMEAELSAPGANATQTGANMLKAFKAVRDDQVKRRDSEPVMLGGQDGGRFYALQPIDPGSAMGDDFISTLRNRDAQAQIAHRIYGGSGSPFTAQEAEGFHQRYADATPQDRIAIIGQLAKGLSPQTFAAALPQVVSGTSAKTDRPGITMAAGLYSQAPEVAGSILQGVDAQKTDEKYVPTGTNRQTYDSSRASYLPAAAFNVASRTDPRGSYASMQDAIDARYAFLSAQAKDVSGNLNSSRLKQAVDDVTGGVLTHNGSAVIAPARGMTQAAFDGVLLGLTDADMAGAMTTSGKPITADFLRGSTRLQAVADGRYLVQINRDEGNPQYAATGDGKPFVLDLRGRKPALASATVGPSFETLMAP
ncbi:transglycosylase SLT domain-containing protein [Bradyrhizobium diazoefficiens]|nr:transglycosylase SLT domain-containing protein [Bradyrhizobium diazoefficiens]MBR0700176.1 transglycosylase SLT domain-containing protein [Bradyrhizobium diazoefficiens]MBR0768511.1 transglycosylase SLT domain-containing protein [Bradyrhizobium diazoefficiens]